MVDSHVFAYISDEIERLDLGYGQGVTLDIEPTYTSGKEFHINIDIGFVEGAGKTRVSKIAVK
jgi:hypothetical protein